jgi:hypothetical protein
MTKRKRNQISPRPFEKGQIWNLKGSHLQIVLVGKTLVHYKQYKGQMKGVRISLSDKESLEKFLAQEKARLVGG